MYSSYYDLVQVHLLSVPHPDQPAAPTDILISDSLL